MAGYITAGYIMAGHITPSWTRKRPYLDICKTKIRLTIVFESSAALYNLYSIGIVKARHRLGSNTNDIYTYVNMYIYIYIYICVLVCFDMVYIYIYMYVYPPPRFARLV